MRFTTFYFSGTGNTKWAVSQFDRIMSEMGQRAHSFSIEDVASQDAAFLQETLSQSDFIGFANPIYGANIPKIMGQFISRLAGIAIKTGRPDKPAYQINTFGFVNGFGPFCAGKLLSNAGLDLVGYVNIRLCSNASTPKAKTKELSPAEMESRKHKAVMELEKAAANLIRGKKSVAGIGPYLIAGMIIRKSIGTMMDDNYKDMGIDMERCAHCMTCANNCPTGSIGYNGEKFSFSSTCTACFRCYNFCPNAAVTVGGAYADTENYKRYRGPDVN